jgi:hypothetical protein
MWNQLYAYLISNRLDAGGIMLEPSLLNKCALLFSVLCAFVPGSALASSSDQRDVMLKYRTTKESHGLYEIRAEGIEFLEREKGKKGVWVAMDPDIRIWVPRCAVPLKTRWAVKADLEENEGVEVKCEKSVFSKQRQWEVLVPAYRATKTH